jgi:UDPglucose--hexose-1-phosphate uridylyltransferase
MPELRQDPATREWVIISKERAKRPHDFIRESEEPALPEYDAECPFCAGNESMTPPETLGYRSGGEPNGPNWWVRVIPNKFAALIPEGSLERQKEEGFFRKMDGVGYHEVIIETPVHNLHMAHMEDKQVEEILLAYRERYLALRENPKVRVILIFKNHGRGAGTSLEHPHSQLVATSIVSSEIRMKLEKAASYYDDNGSCVYCDMMKESLKSGKRIVMETEKFVVFHPFASRVPFQTIIIPKEHQASFGLITQNDSKEFAHILKTVLAKLHRGLRKPDFNFIVHTAPVKDEQEDFYHWHLQIFPRLTTRAGFEMGSGIYINTTMPEETAAFMRNL